MYSAHLLAAAGGDGLPEMDASPNPSPLRSRIVGLATGIFEDRLHMVDMPGIGIESPIDDLVELVTMHESSTKWSAGPRRPLSYEVSRQLMTGSRG